jgi:5-methylcytosine-specific restriction protein A
MVDHKVAHKGDMKLFWDRTNWQPMRRGCNSRKAILQEGGFGKQIHDGVG